MNFRIVFAMLALLGLAGLVHAHDQCSDATLDGRYVTSSHSQFTNPKFNLVDVSANVALINFDGHGHFTVTSGVVNADGTIYYFTENGTYVVNADCSYQNTGILALQTPYGVFNLPSTVAGVIVDHGRRIEIMSGAPNGAGAFTETSGLVAGTVEKLERTECRNPARVHYALHGLILGTPDGPPGNYVAATVVGTASSDDAGNLTGNVIKNFGSNVQPGTINASLVVNPDCTVIWTGAGEGANHFYGVAVMKHDSVDLHMVETDAPPTDPNTGANLPGTTVEFTAVGTPQYE